jgi:Quinolinate synthase
LSVAASEVDNQTVLMCGVRFMAETAKILSPKKTILLVNPEVGRPIHAAVTVDDAKKAEAAHPDTVLLVHPECVPAVVRHLQRPVPQSDRCELQGIWLLCGCHCLIPRGVGSR